MRIQLSHGGVADLILSDDPVEGCKVTAPRCDTPQAERLVESYVSDAIREAEMLGFTLADEGFCVTIDENDRTVYWLEPSDPCVDVSTLIRSTLVGMGVA